MAKDRKVLKRDTEEIRRTFNYKIDDVNLGFTLRIDVKKELKAFLECLESAVSDVKEQIEKVGK